MKYKKLKTENQFADFVHELGGTVYLVGGAVRDEIMQKEAKDRDYVITGLKANKLPFEKIVGQSFPVFLVEIDGQKCEVALARQEKKIGVGYHGFEFHSAPEVTIEQDLSRRDLTINAMAKNILTGELIDPFGGQEDIKKMNLRHIAFTFSEDPLRVYRVARFAAQLGFNVDLHTGLLMAVMKLLLKELTAERVFIELKKVLESENPAKFFQVLKDWDLLDVHFQEIAALDVPDKHDRTAFNHTINLLNKTFEPVNRFALLCHDFGKGLTPKAEHPSHFGHDKLGTAPVNAFCDRLKIPNEYRKLALDFTENHMRLKKFDEMRPAKVIRFAEKENAGLLLYLNVLDSAFRDGELNVDAVKDFTRFKQRLALAEKAIERFTGKDLLEEGFEPGVQFGEILLNRRISLLKKWENEIKAGAPITDYLFNFY